MSIMSCDTDQLASQSDTCDRVSVPAATELDRLLVRATEAAIDASFNLGENACLLGSEPDYLQHQQLQQQQLRELCASNANNNEDDKMQRKKAKKSRTLSRRVRSLFDFVLGGKPQPHQEQQEAAPKPQQLSLPQPRQEWAARQDDVTNFSNEADDLRREAQPAESTEVRGAKRVGGCRRGVASLHARPDHSHLVNASNTVSEGLDEGKEESTEPAREPPQQQTLQVGDSGEQDTAAAASQRAPNRPRCVRGGPTTPGHRRVQEAIFRECRILPVNTLYKKVAMVPGRARLLLSAPNNPRPMGSRMLYDIAYENFRHHSDCNRDFTRVGLKKICPNYCRPSQFRYVY